MFDLFENDKGSVASLSFNDSQPSLWDPSMVRAVATEEEKFDETLRWSIQDAIRNILGESGLEAVRSILHLDQLAKPWRVSQPDGSYFWTGSPCY